MRELTEYFADKTTKPKDKTEGLAEGLLTGNLRVTELIRFAEASKDPILATCIEALEFAAQKDPSLIDAEAFDFVVSTLKHKAPRVKWESAKVIGHCAHLYPKKLQSAIPSLLDNAEHSGTVVRWSAAGALVQILKTGKHNELAGTFEAMMKREEKNSIRKIYEAALKGIAKN